FGGGGGRVLLATAERLLHLTNVIRGGTDGAADELVAGGPGHALGGAIVVVAAHLDALGGRHRGGLAGSIGMGLALTLHPISKTEDLRQHLVGSVPQNFGSHAQLAEAANHLVTVHWCPPLAAAPADGDRPARPSAGAPGPRRVPVRAGDRRPSGWQER